MFGLKATAAAKIAVSATEEAHVCGKGASNDYTFCAPKQAGKDFYVGVHRDAGAGGANDILLIKSLFGTPACRPKTTAGAPAGKAMPEGARIYLVNSCLSGFLLDHAVKAASQIGPNCYGTALSAAGYDRPGYDRLRDRYVDGAEFVYYLKRDFKETACSTSHSYGNVVVYDRRPSPFDHGAHAALELPGQLVFHKGDWMTNYPYEIVAMDGAMQAIYSHYVPRGNERFEPPPDPADYEGYKATCYAEKSGLISRTTSSTKRDRAWFLPLMEFYAKRLREASKFAWGEFKDKRVDLLMVENMWRVLREFEGRIGSSDQINVLLGIDDAVSEAYLEMASLRSQYQAMAGVYAPIGGRHAKEELEELYREHYMTFDRRFEEELAMHLELLKVPAASRKAVVKAFTAQLKKFDPVKFAASDGSEGIPYMEELTKAIRSVVKSWKPPEY